MQTKHSGAQIGYGDFGQGPVVLFIQDNPSDRQVWTGQIDPVVTAGFRVILAELHEDGECIDLINLLDALGIGRAAVCSHTCRGSVLNDLLVHFPHRVAGFYNAVDQSSQNASLVSALQAYPFHPVTHQKHFTTVPAEKSAGSHRQTAGESERNHKLLDFLHNLAPWKKESVLTPLSSGA